MTDTASASNEKKPTPVPVLMAQEALATLEREGRDITELKKSLPGFALRLNVAGTEVSVDLLLAHAREGTVTTAPAPAQKKRTYADIVAGLTAEAEKTWANDERHQHYKVIEAGDLEALKSYSGQLDKMSHDEKTYYAYMAITTNQLAILKYLIDEQGVFDTKDSALEDALGYAVTAGHMDILKYLVEEKGIVPVSIKNNRRCRLETEASLEALKYLVGKGADVAGDCNELLLNAAACGNLRAVKYLIENGAVTEGYTYDILSNTIIQGRLSVLKYFVEELGKAKQYGAHLISASIHSDRMDILKYLGEEYGLDIKNFSHDALAAAVNSDRMDILKYLVEKVGVNLGPASGIAVSSQNARALMYFIEERGVDATLMNPKEKEFLERCLTWRKIAHTLPPQYLQEQNPGYFKPKIYQAIVAMIGEDRLYPPKAREVFAAAALFGNEDRLLQYLEKWGGPLSEPLSPLLRDLQLPAGKIAAQDLACWADAIIKCGPAMAEYLKYADKIPVPAKSADGKSWSMANTRKAVAVISYARGYQNPELAAVCLENKVKEDVFNRALIIANNPPKTKNIPDITIDGRNFDMEGTTFHRLPANDVRGLFLGEMVDCCQSIGKEGEECARSGFKSENEGFYVVENAKGRIIGETWAWRGQNGELVFDSLETLGEQVSDEQWKKLTRSFAEALARKEGTGIRSLHIGFSGFAGTPKSLQKAFKKAASPAIPIGRPAYEDSKKQIIVWKRRPAKARAGTASLVEA